MTSPLYVCVVIQTSLFFVLVAGPDHVSACETLPVKQLRETPPIQH